MTMLVIPQEPDEGLFYVRTWTKGDITDETQFSSLVAATSYMDECISNPLFTRIEFLQAREWLERAAQ